MRLTDILNEATEEVDRYYRSIVNDVHSDLVRHFENTSGDFDAMAHFNIRKDNRGFWFLIGDVLEGWRGTDAGELRVDLIYKNKTPVGDRPFLSVKTDGRKVIGLPVLLEDDINSKGFRQTVIDIFKQYKRSFVHEMIHSFDYDRVNRHVSTTNMDLDGRYYNMGEEINAYYQEALSMFYDAADDYVNGNLPEDHDVRKAFTKRTQKFASEVINQFFDEEFINNISQNNLRKIRKRLANTHMEFVNQYRNYIQ